MTGEAYIFLGALTGLMAMAYKDATNPLDTFGLFFLLALTGAFLGRGISVLV